MESRQEVAWNGIMTVWVIEEWNRDSLVLMEWKRDKEVEEWNRDSMDGGMELRQSEHNLRVKH